MAFTEEMAQQVDLKVMTVVNSLLYCYRVLLFDVIPQFVVYILDLLPTVELDVTQ